MYNFDSYQMTPMMRAEIEQVVAATGLTWGEQSWLRFLPVIIDGAARDAGNTGYTDVLRPNLLMGRVISSKKYKQWDPTATDGTQKVAGILVHELKMQFMSTNTDRFAGTLLVGGGVYSKALALPASATTGIVGATEEYNIRAQMGRYFQFDDDPQGHLCGGNSGVMIVAANATLSDAHAGQLVVVRGASGAVTLTLPANPYKGRRFRVYNAVDQSLTITAGTADTMVVLNDLVSTSVALSTSSEKIGGSFEIIGDGTGWLVIPSLWETQTQSISA